MMSKEIWLNERRGSESLIQIYKFNLVPSFINEKKAVRCQHDTVENLMLCEKYETRLQNRQQKNTQLKLFKGQYCTSIPLDSE